jgi:hypothetical protein
MRFARDAERESFRTLLYVVVHRLSPSEQEQVLQRIVTAMNQEQITPRAAKALIEGLRHGQL